MDIQTCCCTGHRPKGFPYISGVDETKHKGEQINEKKDIKVYFSGHFNFYCNNRN